MSGYLGIDPGLKGALCLFSPTEVVVFDVPTVTVKVGKSTKERMNLHAVAGWLDLHRSQVERAVIEEVGAMPHQGVTSMFSFGFTTGALQMGLAAAGIAYETVRPEAWKARFRLIGQPKDASRAAASKIAPKWSHLWARKKDDGRAEAFLLAVYASLIDVPANYGGSA